ncbi:unnamed protein product [Polarella glacialis]|uniref:Uncharacterized protein n=1 Tax=Polarella glacialis TaxID=89957 RepID=A0A813CZ45_POLGL|nr:unnamed protein product [Polarella glacialis]
MTDRFQKYSGRENHVFRRISDSEFSDVVGSVKTIMSCGGVTFLTVKALQPNFLDIDGSPLRSHPNPYGRTILDAVKAGRTVYVGQSAGTVALSWTLGPLTVDPNWVNLETEDDVLEELTKMPKAALGLHWLFPRFGEYLGMPYRIALRPHLKFNIDTCAYEGHCQGVEKAGLAIAGGTKHDVFVVTLVDYDFAQGMADALEISEGKVLYHVGFCDAEDVVPDQVRWELTRFKPVWKYMHGTMRRPPEGNPPLGLVL